MAIPDMSEEYEIYHEAMREFVIASDYRLKMWKQLNKARKKAVRIWFPRINAFHNAKMKYAEADIEYREKDIALIQAVRPFIPDPPALPMEDEL